MWSVYKINLLCCEYLFCLFVCLFILKDGLIFYMCFMLTLHISWGAQNCFHCKNKEMYFSLSKSELLRNHPFGLYILHGMASLFPYISALISSVHIVITLMKVKNHASVPGPWQCIYYMLHFCLLLPAEIWLLPLSSPPPHLTLVNMIM